MARFNQYCTSHHGLDCNECFEKYKAQIRDDCPSNQIFCQAEAEDEYTDDDGSRRSLIFLQGPEVCEGKGYNKQQCSQLRCCAYEQGQCWSAIGSAKCRMTPTSSPTYKSLNMLTKAAAKDAGLSPAKFLDANPQRMDHLSNILNDLSQVSTPTSAKASKGVTADMKAISSVLTDLQLIKEAKLQEKKHVVSSGVNHVVFDLGRAFQLSKPTSWSSCPGLHVAVKRLSAAQKVTDNAACSALRAEVMADD